MWGSYNLLHGNIIGFLNVGLAAFLAIITYKIIFRNEQRAIQRKLQVTGINVVGGGEYSWIYR
jgi:hypothetical protein